MGKVKGIFVGDISGSVGKVTFRKRSNGNIVSQKVSEVANPRTYAQQVQRMKMNTVTKSYAVLSQICSHSFENCTNKISNKARFIKTNINYLDTNRENGLPINYLFLQKGDEFKYVPDEFYISEGSIGNPVTLIFSQSEYLAILSVNKKNIECTLDITVKEFHEFFNIEIGCQITVVTIESESADDNKIHLSRFIFTDVSRDKKIFTNEGKINISNLAKESVIDEMASIEIYSNGNVKNIVIAQGDNLISAGIILSKKENGKWKYSTTRLCTLIAPTDIPSFSFAQYALPTYSPSQKQYLNNATV